MQLLSTEIFRQCGSTDLQKNYSPLVTRYSPFTIRQSPVANHPQLTAVAGRVILFMAKRRRF
ncbi:hypothetical protein [Fervidibacter sp.]